MKRKLVIIIVVLGVLLSGTMFFSITDILKDRYEYDKVIKAKSKTLLLSINKIGNTSEESYLVDIIKLEEIGNKKR